MSWVTVAHQYLRKYSLEGGPVRSCTADQGPARAASAPLRTVDTEGEKTGSSGEGGRAVLPLQNQQAGSPTCSWRHAGGPAGTATGPVVRETEGVCLNASSPGTNTSPEPLTPRCRGRGEAAGGAVYEWVLWLSHPVAGGPCLRSRASACLFPHQTNGNVSASEGGCKAQTRFWSDCLSLRGQEDRALLRQLRAQRSCPWCPASAPQCLGQEGGAVKGVEGSHMDPSPAEEPAGGLSLLPCKTGTKTPSAQGCGIR